MVPRRSLEAKPQDSYLVRRRQQRADLLWMRTSTVDSSLLNFSKSEIAIHFVLYLQMCKKNASFLCAQRGNGYWLYFVLCNPTQSAVNTTQYNNNILLKSVVVQMGSMNADGI